MKSGIAYVDFTKYGEINLGYYRTIDDNDLRALRSHKIIRIKGAFEGSTTEGCLLTDYYIANTIYYPEVESEGIYENSIIYLLHLSDNDYALKLTISLESNKIALLEV